MSSPKRKVLFVCVHNSARSVMAEAFLNHHYGDRYDAQSAGLEPGRLNPLVVEVMAELGIDVSKKQPQSAFDLFKAGKTYAYIITVCDGANAEKCPIFPGINQRIHWSFDDPSQYTTEHYEKEECLAKIRVIRDSIKKQIDGWVANPGKVEFN